MEYEDVRVVAPDELYVPAEREEVLTAPAVRALVLAVRETLVLAVRVEEPLLTPAERVVLALLALAVERAAPSVRVAVAVREVTPDVLAVRVLVPVERAAAVF